MANTKISIKRGRWLNHVLSRVGIQITRTPRSLAPADFKKQYDVAFAALQKTISDVEWIGRFYYDAGAHPENHIDAQCAFTSFWLRSLNPSTILDIGSFRHFIIGLLAHYDITSLDVRPRKGASEHETVLVSDAKDIQLPSNQFDVVTSLYAVQNFGFGRYGDEIDMTADQKALAEMIRVLRPGGHLILGTIVHQGRPVIVFNGHKIYSPSDIRKLCQGLEVVDEKVFSTKRGEFISPDEVTSVTDEWDMHCGCYRKQLA